MSCRLNYSGNLSPVVRWAAEIGSYAMVESSSTASGVFTSSLKLTVNTSASVNCIYAQTFNSTITFSPASFKIDTSLWNNVLAINVPDYIHTWTWTSPEICISHSQATDSSNVSGWATATDRELSSNFREGYSNQTTESSTCKRLIFYFRYYDNN